MNKFAPIIALLIANSVHAIEVNAKYSFQTSDYYDPFGTLPFQDKGRDNPSQVKLGDNVYFKVNHVLGETYSTRTLAMYNSNTEQVSEFTHANSSRSDKRFLGTTILKTSADKLYFHANNKSYRYDPKTDQLKELENLSLFETQYKYTSNFNLVEVNNALYIDGFGLKIWEDGKASIKHEENLVRGLTQKGNLLFYKVTYTCASLNSIPTKLYKFNIDTNKETLLYTYSENEGCDYHYHDNPPFTFFENNLVMMVDDDNYDQNYTAFTINTETNTVEKIELAPKKWNGEKYEVVTPYYDHMPVIWFGERSPLYDNRYMFVTVLGREYELEASAIWDLKTNTLVDESVLNNPYIPHYSIFSGYEEFCFEKKKYCLINGDSDEYDSYNGLLNNTTFHKRDRFDNLNEIPLPEFAAPYSVSTLIGSEMGFPIIKSGERFIALAEQKDDAFRSFIAWSQKQSGFPLFYRDNKGRRKVASLSVNAGWIYPDDSINVVLKVTDAFELLSGVYNDVLVVFSKAIANNSLFLHYLDADNQQVDVEIKDVKLNEQAFGTVKPVSHDGDIYFQTVAVSGLQSIYQIDKDYKSARKYIEFAAGDSLVEMYASEKRVFYIINKQSSIALYRLNNTEQNVEKLIDLPAGSLAKTLFLDESFYFHVKSDSDSLIKYHVDSNTLVSIDEKLPVYTDINDFTLAADNDVYVSFIMDGEAQLISLRDDLTQLVNLTVGGINSHFEKLAGTKHKLYFSCIDQTGNQALCDFSLSVPVFGENSLDLTVNKNTEFTFADLGLSILAPATSFTIENAPDWLTINESTGEISGVANGNVNELTSVTIYAHNQFGISSPLNVNIKTIQVEIPTIDDITVENSEIRIQPAVSSSAPSVLYHLENAPDWLKINHETGEIYGNAQKESAMNIRLVAEAENIQVISNEFSIISAKGDTKSNSGTLFFVLLSLFSLLVYRHGFFKIKRNS